MPQKKIELLRAAVRAWGPALLWALFIFWLSSRQLHLPSTMRLPGADKLAHTVFYAVLSFFLARALRECSAASLKNHFRVSAIMLAFVYGFFDEAHQAFVPGRTACIVDLLFDGIGASLGVLFVPPRVVLFGKAGMIAILLTVWPVFG